jgi:hypothetical protein
MRVKNFPKRKLERQFKAAGVDLASVERQLNDARSIRTKKNRSLKHK